mmetsp:Transcript_12791/g.39280  ORF Transcript_12791/g.39280 Transcript_12791/m.39280 type:complete len:128 (+) Transcript_12791:56-439(+)
MEGTRVVRVNRSTVLSLYRSILRLHQRKLSSDLRELADKYLKNEFKAHKKATEDQAREFMAQWLMYHEHLRQAKSEEMYAKNLSASEIEQLSDDQLQKLNEMKTSTQEMAKKMDEEERVQSTPQTDG